LKKTEGKRENEFALGTRENNFNKQTAKSNHRRVGGEKQAQKEKIAKIYEYPTKSLKSERGKAEGSGRGAGQNAHKRLMGLAA